MVNDYLPLPGRLQYRLCDSLTIPTPGLPYGGMGGGRSAGQITSLKARGRGARRALPWQGGAPRAAEMLISREACPGQGGLARRGAGALGGWASEGRVRPTHDRGHPPGAPGMVPKGPWISHLPPYAGIEGMVVSAFFYSFLFFTTKLPSALRRYNTRHPLLAQWTPSGLGLTYSHEI